MTRPIGTTLNVADGTKFATPYGAAVGAVSVSSPGYFTGTGLNGTCKYTGVSSNQLTGVTGCTGTAKDVTKLTIVNAAGVYKWDDTEEVGRPVGSGPRRRPPGEPGR